MVGRTILQLGQSAKRLCLRETKRHCGVGNGSSPARWQMKEADA
jgi:hypothetical protein